MELLSWSVCCSCIVLVLGYGRYRNEIPNGHQVKHPCTGTIVWGTVGHMEEFHVIEKNMFGLDWKASGFNWTAICPLDSDQDGKTNGEELGDTNCVWHRGRTPEGSVTGHPGFCDVGREYCGEERASYKRCRQPIRKPPVNGRGPPGQSPPSNQPFVPRVSSEPHPHSSGSPKLRGMQQPPSFTVHNSNPWGSSAGRPNLGAGQMMGPPGYQGRMPGGMGRMPGGMIGGMTGGMPRRVPFGMGGTSSMQGGMQQGVFPGQGSMPDFDMQGGSSSQVGMGGMGGMGRPRVRGVPGGVAGAMGGGNMMQRPQRQRMEAERIRQTIMQFSNNQQRTGWSAAQPAGQGAFMPQESQRPFWRRR